MATKTQKELIREYLEHGNSLTPMDALELFGCFRLATRIFELKREGLDIVTDMVENKATGKRYASYRLVPAPAFAGAIVAENTKQRRSKFARLVDAEHAKRVKQVLRAEYQRAVTEVQFWDTILQTCPHYRNRYFDRLHGLNYSQSYKGRTAAAWLEYWRGRAERVSNWLREFRPRRRGAKCK